MDEALAVYRERFRPSGDLAESYAMVAVTVVCADTDEEARRLARSGALSMVRLRQGDLRTLPSPEDAAAHAWTFAEEDAADQMTASWVIGTPETCVDGLRAVRDRTGADELMIAGHVWDAKAHRLSFTLLSEALSLGERVPVGPASG